MEALSDTIVVVRRDAEELDRLLTCAPAELADYDIARMNLLCAQDLPGAEALNIEDCLNMLDDLARYCKSETERNLYRFHRNPEEANNSEAYYRMMLLITILKLDYGLRYDPDIVRKIDKPDIPDAPADFSDSRGLFIRGLLGPERTGTCNSIPVFVTAVARRMGYPVKLACTHWHVFARWESPDGSERFNVEASNPAGMTSDPDEHYRHWPVEMEEWEAKAGYYLKSFGPEDELALFLISRVMCLDHIDRREEALPFMARAVMLAPDEPVYPRFSYRVLVDAFRSRYKRLHPEFEMPDYAPGDFSLPFDPFEVLTSEEQPLSLTVAGHDHEVREETHLARLALERAYVESGRKPTYRDDLDRFLRKWLLRGTGRKFELHCHPSEEHRWLREIARDSAVRGELVKTRDALAEAYLLNRRDVAALDSLKRIEQMQDYQAELKAAESSRQKQELGANQKGE